MKSKSSHEGTSHRSTSSSAIRNTLKVSLGLAVGSLAGYQLNAHYAAQERDKLEVALAQKDEDLLDCKNKRKKGEVELRSVKVELKQAVAAKEKLNDWQTFLRGLKSRETESSVGEDDVLKQCRDIEGKQREALALEALKLFGITNEADRQAIIDSYRQGCYINSIDRDGTLNMQERSAPYCSVELQESSKKNFIDPDAYADGSVAEKRAMEYFRDKEYERALEAYAPVIDEAQRIAEANPGIKNLPFYGDFSSGFKSMYDDFRQGKTLEGMCRLGRMINVLGDLEEDPALLALVEGDAEEDLLVIARKLGIFGDIMGAVVNRDYPQYLDSNPNSPELFEACRQIGMETGN